MSNVQNARLALADVAKLDQKPDFVVMLNSGYILIRCFNGMVAFEQSIAQGVNVESAIEEDGLQLYMASDGFFPQKITVCRHEDETPTVSVEVEECPCHHHLNAVVRIPKDRTFEAYGPEANMLELVNLFASNGAGDVKLGIGGGSYSPLGPLPFEMAFGFAGLLIVVDEVAVPPFILDGLGAPSEFAMNLGSIDHNAGFPHRGLSRQQQ